MANNETLNTAVETAKTTGYQTIVGYLTGLRDDVWNLRTYVTLSFDDPNATDRERAVRIAKGELSELETRVDWSIAGTKALWQEHKKGCKVAITGIPKLNSYGNYYIIAKSVFVVGPDDPAEFQQIKLPEPPEATEAPLRPRTFISDENDPLLAD